MNQEQCQHYELKIKRISNRRGSILISAMLLVGLFAITALVIQQFHKMNLASLRVARARTVMSSIENQIKFIATQPLTYSNCDSKVGFSACTLNLNAFAQFKNIPIPGVWCGSPGNGCTIHLTPPTLISTPGTGVERVVKAKLIFNPNQTTPDDPLAPKSESEISIKDVDIIMPIPTEILQTYNMDCALLSGTSPIFKGFDPITGKIICAPLSIKCPVGSFVSGYNSKTLAPICTRMDTVYNGNGTNYLKSMTWVQKSEYIFTPQPRLDPFTVFSK